MFIQTEPTPNPDTIKFLPGREVAGTAGPFDYAREEASTAAPMAQTLFDQVDGIARVFLGSEFISITKKEDADWTHVKPLSIAAIMDHFVAGMPVLEAGAVSYTEDDVDDIEYEGETAEIVAEIRELIDTRVRPAVAQDGGDITFRRFEADTGIVKLTMRGACAGCPSSTMTLKQGIENMLKAYVPEVTAVEAVL